MGLLDELRRRLRREQADARDWLEDAVADGHAALDRAERHTSTDPEERLDATLDAIADGEAQYDAIRRRAEGADGS